MIKSLFLFIFCLSITSYHHAQDILVSVKKGFITIDQVRWQSTYPPKKLNKTSIINSTDDAIILVRKGSKFAKIYCPCENLNYSVINQKINGQAIKSNSYSNVIFNKPLESEIGTQKGSVSRGTDQSETFYINIVDSALIFNNEYNINWRSTNELKYIEPPKIKSLVDDTFIELNGLNNIQLSQFKTGWYEFTLKASQISGENTVAINVKSIFRVLTQEEKNQILLEIEKIKKETTLLGEDIYEIYLQDFLNSNKIIGY